MSGESNGTSRRPGNRALLFIESQYHPLTDEIRAITGSLPSLAQNVYELATESAIELLKAYTNSTPAKQLALADSIFDLQLTAYFAELEQYVTNPEAASLLSDALLYQATGHEIATPSDQDFVSSNTQNIHGIGKFQIAQQRMPGISDPAGWLFAKEYAMILRGVEDPELIISVLPDALGLRVRAGWLIRFLLYKTAPTKEEQDALDAQLERQAVELLEAFKAIGQSSAN